MIRRISTIHREAHQLVTNVAHILLLTTYSLRRRSSAVSQCLATNQSVEGEVAFCVSRVTRESLGIVKSYRRDLRSSTFPARECGLRRSLGPICMVLSRILVSRSRTVP
jgi:hypothetical protein